MILNAIQELNEIATQFFQHHSFDMQMLVYQWHDKEVQAKVRAALQKVATGSSVAVSAAPPPPAYSVRVMTITDAVHTAVQCASGAMICTGRPLELISGDLGYVNLNPEGDDVSVLIMHSAKRRCFVMRTLTYVTTNVWLSVGHKMCGARSECTAVGPPAMILQEHTVFRVGSHRFRVMQCRPVRKHARFHHAIAPACPLNVSDPAANASFRVVNASTSDMSSSPLSVPDEMAADEEETISIHCVSPPTSACYNKIVKFKYNYGGHEVRFGDSDVCFFKITDGSVSGVTTRVVALLGHFWLVDGPEKDVRSHTGGTYVKVGPASEPVPLRSAFGIMRLVFEPLNGARSSSSEFEIVECV